MTGPVFERLVSGRNCNRATEVSVGSILFSSRRRHFPGRGTYVLVNSNATRCALEMIRTLEMSRACEMLQNKWHVSDQLKLTRAPLRGSMAGRGSMLGNAVDG